MKYDESVFHFIKFSTIKKKMFKILRNSNIALR